MFIRLATGWAEVAVQLTDRSLITLEAFCLNLVIANENNVLMSIH